MPGNRFRDLPEAFQAVDTLLLDMDGVVTSEESYFDAAGLTIREVLESPLYLGLSPPDYTPIPEVFYRRMASASRLEWRKYLPNELIIRCKNRGISTNWDLAYLVVALYIAPLVTRALYPLIVPEESLEQNSLSQRFGRAEGDAFPWRDHWQEKEVRRGLGKLARTYRRAARRKKWSSALRAQDFLTWGGFLRSRSFEVSPRKGIELKLFDDFHPQTRGLALLDQVHESVPGVGQFFVGLFGRNTPLWSDLQALFQEWYLGEELYAEQTGRPVSAWPKPGLIRQEEPLLGRERTYAALARLRGTSLTLAVATGRPKLEILWPLKTWGMDRFFDPARIATHDDIEQAERILRRKQINQSLSKPNPFLFLRAIHPDLSPVAIHEGRYDSRQHKRFAVVGDAVADIWAGKQIGCPTVAVLSGVAGPRGRRQLEDAGPDLVVKNLEELAGLLTRYS